MAKVTGKKVAKVTGKKVKAKARKKRWEVSIAPQERAFKDKAIDAAGTAVLWLAGAAVFGAGIGLASRVIREIDPDSGTIRVKMDGEDQSE